MLLCICIIRLILFAFHKHWWNLVIVLMTIAVKQTTPKCSHVKQIRFWHSGIQEDHRRDGICLLYDICTLSWDDSMTGGNCYWGHGIIWQHLSSHVWWLMFTVSWDLRWDFQLEYFHVISTCGLNSCSMTVKFVEDSLKELPKRELLNNKHFKMTKLILHAFFWP